MEIQIVYMQLENLYDNMSKPFNKPEKGIKQETTWMEGGKKQSIASKTILKVPKE